MKISVNILKKLGNISANNDEIVKAIKTHIGEVEDAHNIEEDYENIVVAEIKDKKDHPDADKLGVYQLDFGEESTVQVLAGDKTLEIGNKVAYLKPEAKVPYTIYTEEKPFVISTVKMRGLPSNGMMGSEKELNLGPDHTIVMRLPKDAKVGESFAKYYGLDDYVIDIENKALTNRGDLFGILGVARELTVIFGQPFTSPDWYLNQSKNLKPESNCLELNIINDSEILCPRYTAIAMDNISVAPSPIWLKSALVRFGYKSINNVVDITNYISQLVGQPLHAFDYDKVVSNDPNNNGKANINIRMARNSESILGLDNKVHELNDKVMVIADSTNPIAIAGVIGGADTEVDNNTKRIIIECANFDKTNIRKTSMMLGINTDAATKYKHALDPEQCIPTLNRTVEMVSDIAHGVVASEIFDIYTQPVELKTISLSLDKLKEHLGTNLENDTVKQILSNLEYKILGEENGILTVQAPTWRKDIVIKEDIHEDIGRIYGYNNIKPVLPLRNVTPAKSNNIFSLKQTIRQILADNGCNETDTYNFIDIDTLSKCNLDSNLAYRVKNALAPELSLMRTSLIPSLIVKTQENLQRGFNKFALFEFNIPHIKGYLDENELPKEEWHLDMVLTEVNKRYDSAYYLAKRYSEKVLNTLGIEDIKYTLLADTSYESLAPDLKNTSYIFDPNTSARITVDNLIIGIVGEIDNKVKGNFKLPKYTAALDLNINILTSLSTKIKKFVDISKYPEVSIDLCFEVENTTKYVDMYKDIMNIVNNDELQGVVTCLDIYQGKDNENKRITFRLNLRNYSKTLKDKDVKAISEKITRKLEYSYKAKLI